MVHVGFFSGAKDEDTQTKDEPGKAPMPRKESTGATLGVKPWASQEEADSLSPTRKRISDGIQALISRLHIGES